MLAVATFVCMHHATNANNTQHCLAQQCCDLLRPFTLALALSRLEGGRGGDARANFNFRERP